ncbi:MAG: hypothetical protein KBC64_06555, partial [Simkaniaceae bacterium]|nr:hypothetical protein [Simkaniaceae bacterium]
MNYISKPQFFKLIFCSAVASSLVAAEKTETAPPSADELHQELEQAQRDFEYAQKLFNPYYAGPLLAPSPHNVGRHHINLQPYLYFYDRYGSYTNSGHMESADHNTYELNPLSVFQVGLTDWMDLTFVPGVQMSWNHGAFYGHPQDLPIQLGFQICKEKPHYVPAIRLVFGETLPCGHYDHLSPEKNGTDATGAGAYQFTSNLILGKVFWWSSLHPINFRLSINYAISSIVKVESFNAYGGSYGTKGKVRPGNLLSLDLGLEVSLTQKWVFATDVVYSYQKKSKFHGNPGYTLDGSPVSNGVGISES